MCSSDTRYGAAQNMVTNDWIALFVKVRVVDLSSYFLVLTEADIFVVWRKCYLVLIIILRLVSGLKINGKVSHLITYVIVATKILRKYFGRAA